MTECIRMEYFEDESFFFFGRTKISSIFATAFHGSSSVGRAQPCPKRLKVPTLARKKQHRQTANAKQNNAEVAQLVEHNLAKVGVAGSSPVFRSRKKIVGSNGGIGRHEGLKIPWPVMAVRVQVPLRVRLTPF